MIIVIVGLPGSGKTFLANQINKDNYFIVFDDIVDLQPLKQALENKKDCIITDCYLCFKDNQIKAQQLLQQYDNDIQWIFFENNTEKCLNNVRTRNDGRKVKNAIKDFSKKYYIPENTQCLKIWQEQRENL